MKKITKYALLMAVAIFAALQLTACDSDIDAINDIVEELKEDDTFDTVEYNGKDIVATANIDDPDMEGAIATLGADHFADVIKSQIVQEMKGMGKASAKDKAQIQALINKDCSLKIVINAGSQSMDIVIPPHDFAKLLEN